MNHEPELSNSSQKDTTALRDNNSRIWAVFLKMLRKSKLPYVWIIVNFILALASSKLTLLFPDYTEKVIGGDLSKKTMLFFVLVIILSNIVSTLISLISGLTVAKITKGMRTTIWGEITRLPIHVLERENAKELISRTTQDTTAMGNMIASTLPSIISSIVLIVGSIAAVNSYNHILMVSLIVLIVFQLLVTVMIGKINFKYNNSVQLHLAKLTEVLSEVLANVPLVKTFVTEKKEEERGARYIDKYLKTNFKFQVLNTLSMRISEIVSIIGVMSVIIIGAILVSNKSISIGQWLAYFMYYNTLQYSVGDIPYYWRDIKASQGISRRISEVACLDKEDSENGLAFSATHNDITFHNVKFCYENKQVLNGFDMIIPHGKTTALVGQNGTGKSTILSLIERFYAPESGEIKYGDTNINEYKLKDWRKSFGYVSQDIKLFSGTIYENITYGLEKEVSNEELEQACKKADALEFIESFPEGFHTNVGEFGEKLSGGQRQRICIARAILTQPEFLLLDEYTSNLDLEAEVRVQNAILEISKGKTTIIIAHRMATIQSADHIVVINDGSVCGNGDHKSLLSSNELYRNIIDKQAFA